MEYRLRLRLLVVSHKSTTENNHTAYSLLQTPILLARH